MVHTIDWRIANDRLMPFAARSASLRGIFSLAFRVGDAFLVSVATDQVGLGQMPQLFQHPVPFGLLLWVPLSQVTSRASSRSRGLDDDDDSEAQDRAVAPFRSLH